MFSLIVDMIAIGLTGKENESVIKRFRREGGNSAELENRFQGTSGKGIGSVHCASVEGRSLLCILG